MQLACIVRAAYDPQMADDVDAIRALLAELDQHLVKLLMDAGVPALEHIIVAIGSDGHAHVHGNVDLNGLKTLAGKLIDLLHEDRRALSDVLGLH